MKWVHETEIAVFFLLMSIYAPEVSSQNLGDTFVSLSGDTSSIFA
ncbi:hypothetical protein MMMB2_3837 [Mycobacterium marinum MB2]|nr:hypothetical protein MMMB2_3837 [Mycobacterium marinum MB2]